jgi:NitT/TauT family transport system substrate-binding protein
VSRPRVLAALLVTTAVLAGLLPAHAQTKLRVGWCARTVTSGAAPFAIATRMGWFKNEGVEVELVPNPGSIDCVKNVATRELAFSLPGAEALAAGRAQGLKTRVYYTTYQGNVYGIAVPAESSIQSMADLRGKNIGVTSMASTGVIIARALASASGLDPDRDLSIVVAGEGAQSAAMLRNGQIAALSQFDTQYALVENAGVKLRLLDTKAIDRFPSNGIVALEETLRTRTREAVGLARAYAMGTVFAIANPEAAVRIFWDVYPYTKPTGKDDATSLRDDVKVLQARIVNWKLEKAGVRRWGESAETNYAALADFLLKWGVLKEKVEARDLLTNELIDEINRFDAVQVAAEARAWKK